jgi:predicted ATPase
MKIEVKNFGKIKKGQIDLDKKVTVFVGYNNSGKTYMSQLLWSLNSLEYLTKYSLKNYFNEEKNESLIVISEEIISKILYGYEEYIKNSMLPSLFNVKEKYFSDENFSIKLLENHLENINSQYYNFIAVIKNERNSNSYSRYYSFKKEKNSLNVFIEKKEFDTPIQIRDIFKLSISDDPVEFENSYISFFEYNSSFNEICESSLLSIVMMTVFEKRYFPFLLPANRVFYPSYYKYIYSIAKLEKDIIDDKLKKGATLESIKALSQRPYTQPMDDLIQKFYGLNTNIGIKKEYDDLLSELKKLIGGDIIIKSSEGVAPIEFYLMLEGGKELEMYMSSSSANQLTTLYLYLKYWVEIGDNFLIIDEPEENLHPENQIKLVDILMKFADRSNNKILITTHSPLITDHVNNYANLSYLNEANENTEKLIEDGKSSMVAVKNIKHEDFGVYFFNGDSIKEYAVDDYGAYFKDFQAAEDKVKNMSNILKENIYNYIHSDAKELL